MSLLPPSSSSPSSSPSSVLAASRLSSCLDVLSSARMILAPMVGAADLPWRRIVKRKGACVLYSQMFDSRQFVNDEEYRKQMFLIGVDSSLDRPFIVQFASNQPETFLQAAKLVEPYCDGVELNLGCPQRSARTEQFGAFLLERSHYQTIVEILSLAKSHLSIPVCAKIRLLPTLHLTIEFVRIIAPYIDVLTIHGRTRGFVEERRKGPADLEQIRLVFQAIRKDEKERNCHQTQSMTPDTSSSSSSSPATPTISATRRPLILWTNGNVRCDSDIQRNIDFTGADGAMIGEAALADPTIFERAVKTTTLSSSVYPTAEFSGEDSLLTLAEFDRKLAIMNEYVDLIQDTSLDYLSPFDSHADDRHRPSVSSSFDLLDDHPLVTWSIFHSHMYRLFNSDSRSRFLRFTQLQDEFLDCETLKDLRNILEEVRQRLVSERRFDFELQRKIEKERGKRQATRLGRQRKKLYQHATTTSMVNATNNADSHLQPNESHHTDPSKVLHMNSRERKRARWQERNREKKRQKVEQTDEEGKQLQVQQADVTPPPSVDTLHVEPEETNQPLPTNSNSNVSGAI